MREYEKSPGGTVQTHGAPGAFVITLAVTAAAGKQNDGNDDQPKSAIVKQIAKTVIHNRSSVKSLKKQMVLLLCYHIMTSKKKGAGILSRTERNC